MNTPLISVAEIEKVILRNEPAAHRLIDRLREAELQQLPEAVNE